MHNSYLLDHNPHTGLLLWSIHCMQQQRDLLGCILFAILLNMKHLFAYSAPVFLVYTLRHYCVGRYGFMRFLAVGLAVTAVFAASFGPFLAMGQLKQAGFYAADMDACISWWLVSFLITNIPQVLTRLFPFGRGLTHAYWAGNAWALYSFADKLLAVLLPRLGWEGLNVARGNLAGG